MKTETKVLGPVQEVLLKREDGAGRDKTVLHPSEICKEGWCARAAYFELKGTKNNDSPGKVSWQREIIFDEGHLIHDKWQGYMWDAGILQGSFRCGICKHQWWGISPNQCINCPNMDRSLLRYEEVSLRDPSHLLGGHADGFITGNSIVELKSIGIGTLRWENPTLLEKHTHIMEIDGRNKELIDYNKLWEEITHPFSTHVRQASLYTYMWNLKFPNDDVQDIVFIYECKWNQRVKEFVVQYKEHYISSILEGCEEVVNGLRYDRPPLCSQDRIYGCPECNKYEGPLLSASRGRQIRRIHRSRG